MLDYDYITNQYKLIAVDLSRQKELDADPKSTHQIKFVLKLKNVYSESRQSPIHVDFKDFRKNQRNKTKILSRECKSLINDREFLKSKSQTEKIVN